MIFFNSIEINILPTGIEHSDTVHAVHEHGVNSFFAKDLSVPKPPGDILITNTPNLSLTHGFADCVPLLFFDPVHSAVAFTHAGWKGLTAGSVPISMLQLARHFGTKAENLQVWIGPCIQKQSYRFKDAPLQAQLPAWKDHVSNDDEYFHIDLVGFALAQCQAFGIPLSHIDQDGRDTYTDAQLSSHMARKEGREEKKGNFYITCRIIHNE